MRSAAYQMPLPGFISTGVQISTQATNLRPGARMLDLFCGGGLAAWGYWKSGAFNEIVGIDLSPQPAYPFTFYQRDAIALDYEFLAGFDFIHASPPCQAYSKVTPRASRGLHLKLIASTHLMCIAAGIPYVIENVEGSSLDLRPNLIIDGLSIGLGMKRTRYFYVSVLKRSIRMISSLSPKYKPHNGNQMRRDDLMEAFALEDFSPSTQPTLTRDAIKQGIPPAMTQWIAENILFKDPGTHFLPLTRANMGDNIRRYAGVAQLVERLLPKKPLDTP